MGVVRVEKGCGVDRCSRGRGEERLCMFCCFNSGCSGVCGRTIGFCIRRWKIWKEVTKVSRKKGIRNSVLTCRYIHYFTLRAVVVPMIKQ